MKATGVLDDGVRVDADVGFAVRRTVVRLPGLDAERTPDGRLVIDCDTYTTCNRVFAEATARPCLILTAPARARPTPFGRSSRSGAPAATSGERCAVGLPARSGSRTSDWLRVRARRRRGLRGATRVVHALVRVSPVHAVAARPPRSGTGGCWQRGRPSVRPVFAGRTEGVASSSGRSGRQDVAQANARLPGALPVPTKPNVVEPLADTDPLYGALRTETFAPLVVAVPFHRLWMP